MANWRRFSDRMLYCHPSLLKTWRKSSSASRFHNSCTRRGGLLLGGGPLRHCSSSPRPPPGRVSAPSPLLMVPPTVVVDQKNSEKYSKTDDNKSNNEDYFNFFSLSEQSQFRVRKNLRIPWQRDLLTPDGAPCVGSSHGWLAFNHPRNCHPYLYKPLIDSPHLPYIPLPSLETLPSVCGVRLLKSDNLSPSPSIITRFLLLDKSKELSISSEVACYHLVARLVMSSAPSFPCYCSLSSSTKSKPKLDDYCTIMAIHGGSYDIAFCKPGDDRWTVLDGSNPPYFDIMYFSKDQRFYALKSDFSIEAWDLKDPSSPKNQVFDRPDLCPGKLEHKFRESFNCVVSKYLVESSGDLLLLSRFIAGIPHPPRLEEEVVNNNINDDDDDEEEECENDFIHDDEAYWTLGFEVRKFDFDLNKWEPVECLGDRVLFVGSNHSFSLSTRDYPKLMGNSIYFTDDNFMEFNDKYHGHDNGVFCLGEKGIKPYYPSRLKIINPPPVWVAPNTI